MRLVLKFLSAACLMMPAAPASAAIVDPAGDFLASYTGPIGSDLDIRSADVAFDGTSFLFRLTEAGPVGATPNSLFVWALNRGSGIARPALAPPDAASALWDAVVVMFPDGTLRVVTFAAGPPTILTFPGQTSVAGDTLSAAVGLSLLPSTGFAPSDYTFSLWSRVRVNPAADGLNTEVADLLAGSASIHARAVPEPATWLSLLVGFALIGAGSRMARRKSLRTA